MAQQTYPIGLMGDPATAGYFVNLLWDDVTLLITDIEYENTMPRDVAVTWNGHTKFLLAGTRLTDSNIAPAGEHMTMITNHRGNLVPLIPGGDMILMYPGR